MQRRRDAAAKADPYGDTPLLTASLYVVNLLLNKSVPLHVVKDFTPVTLIAVVGHRVDDAERACDRASDLVASIRRQ